MASPRKGKKKRREAGDAVRAIAFVRTHRNKALTIEERLGILVLQANHGTIFTAAQPANRGDRISRLPNSLAMQEEVRGFIRSRSETRTRTTSKDVMHLLAEESYLSVDISNTDSINTAIRTVQRFLKKEGYSRGAQKGKADKEAELLLATLDIFEGGKQSADYHCHEYFVGWMDTLLETLSIRELSKCIIVMDNAKYHKVLPETTPKQGSRRAKMISAMNDYKLRFQPAQQKQYCGIYSQSTSKTIEKGHEIIFTPPHSDLQPIEIVWANVKGEVGRQYSTKTTFADIKPRLQRALENVSPVSVQGCIDAANRQLTKLKKHLEAMDSCDEASCDSENESD
ncbi:DDE superfamily endonuclease [Phytophthora infestans]|uniref:DDE superfamily endonuclease n=1 Tax=Phytophthora infestans TaxID=4787 RepID=A0A8S9V324_PHYIN|nr:DDE superfamily endonuclease [Phytophthora infestans]